MGAFFVYILKSAVCLALFYLFYRLLLSRETFHRFNRVALLGLLLLSCLIPLAEVTLEEPMEVSRQLFTWEELLLMADVDGEVAEAEAVAAPVLTGRVCLLAVYLIGMVVLFLWRVGSLCRMFRLMRRSTVVRREKDFTLITHRKEIAPFSWMRFVVVSEKDLDENGDEILAHECAHIRRRHSIDLLVADVCILFQWFNPAAWLLKQELQDIHEYEADESVINQGIDAKRYQLLLIKKAVGTRLYSMANSFNHSSLKKRITMMLRKKSNPWARLKYLYVLPLAAMAVAAFARPEISNELNEISAVKVNDLTAIVKPDEVKIDETAPLQSPKTVKLTGLVKDKADFTPIASASVLIKGTNQGTIADLDGKFVLEVPEKGCVLALSFIGYATQEVAIPAGTKQVEVLLEKDGSDKPNYIPVPTDSPVYQVVEEMPEFPGGMAACLKFLGENIKYPAEAMKAGKQGKVIVQFVVEKDGSISNPQVVRSVDSELDGEAIRVVSIMPKWKPGYQKGEPVAVKFTIPVAFRLTGDNTPADTTNMFRIRADKEGVGFSVGNFRVYNVGEEPLILVDGVEADRATLNRIVEKIESVEVKKGEASVAQYGEKAKNGVILVVTKKDK